MKKKYDDFMLSSCFANSMQDIRWALLKADWDNEQVYIEKNGEIIAAISIIFRKAVLSSTMAYAPRGPVCDIYNIELVKNLMNEAKIALRKHKAFLLKIDPEIIYDEDLCNEFEKIGFISRNRNIDKHALIQPRYNMMLDISDKTFDELMPSFSEKTRYNIRLSARKGVTVRYSRDIKDLKIFYDIYLLTTERDKIGRRPFSYFERMLAAFDGDFLRIYIAEYDNQPLSAALAINYGRKMWYIYGASSNEKRNLMPNYLMQSEMIKWAIENKCKLYDFGGVFELVKTNGLFKFKEGFCREKGIIELIGEFDMVLNPILYFMFDKMLPQIKKIIKRK